jgi:hypothetical protein
MTYSFLILALVFLPAGHQAKRCACPPVPTQEQTRWGNDNITLSTVIAVRVLRGAVTIGADEPMVNALVEILNHPDVILLPYSLARESRRRNQRRIAACFTDGQGRFCLPKLPPGRYELRCSATGFHALSQTIKVVRNGRGKKQILVRLLVAT